MSDSEFNEKPEAGDTGSSSSSGLSIGEQLSRQRQELGWTVEQVASQLYLAPKQVVAIEANDFAALPTMAVTRGFIRAYAKLVRLDPAQLMAALPKEAAPAIEPTASRRAISEPFSERRSPLMTGRSNGMKKPYIVLAVLALLALLAWAVYQSGVLSGGTAPAVPKTAESTSPDKPAEKSGAVGAEPASPSAPDAATGSAAASSAPATPAAAPEAKPETAAPVPAPSRPATPEKAAPSGSIDAAAEKQVVNTPATDSKPAAEATSSNGLVLQFREDSWVDLKRAGESKSMVARLFKAGSTENFDVPGQAVLVLGNAPGVDVTFRGAPIKTKGLDKGHVARLTLK
ncbi:cytoskeleton protein RodZ [Noviherbaspirillum humi]|uniref:Cytoskeleton protein RodZ n=1 Tax=Noviherbaspirillum humi TaxID=1688639 RepID=A0A239FST2_9BURK|nr:helix-turn-helix domain-containing protein [Noviherbaspirillum humi]SNS59203.1 cytoskeleton protein RodZ [Noviherbaspirillum humi]